MKTYLIPIALLLFACSERSESRLPVDDRSSESKENDKTEVAEQKESNTPTVRFEIVRIKDGEYDLPRNVLYLNVDGKKTYLDTISACSEILAKTFDQYDIPKTALHACGGWWAGSGEYFYVTREKDELKVFEGWQDETQEDEGFHWKEWKKIGLK